MNEWKLNKIIFVFLQKKNDEINESMNKENRDEDKNGNNILYCFW